MVIKLEYKMLEEKLNDIFGMTDVEAMKQRFAELIPRLKSQHVRFIIYYNREYYQANIEAVQKSVDRCLRKKRYDLVANKQHVVKHNQKQVEFIEGYFEGNNYPSCKVDANGLISCYLHVEDRQRVHLIRDYGVIKRGYR